MSDPVTNVEIEDVLSSIRRLVSDGDKARTRDPAPVEISVGPPEGVSEEPVSTSESSPVSSIPDAGSDRLVLTPAFLVVDPQPEDQKEEPAHAEPEHHKHEAQEHAEQDNHDGDHEEVEQTVEDDVAEAPLSLTEMIQDEDAASDADGAAYDEDVVPDEPVGASETPDRSGLVATIAELEAAISAGDEEYEPDGSEAMPETMAWPGAVPRGADSVEDAEVSEDEPTVEDSDDTVASFAHRDVEDHAPEVQDASTEHTQSAAPDVDDPAEDYGDDDLDGLLDVGGAAIDEEALRELVASVVREELTGPLGERITRNVRKLVRREIYRILSSQEFD